MLGLKLSQPDNQRQHIGVFDIARVTGARPTEHVGDVYVSVKNGSLMIEVQRIDESATGPVVVTVR